MLAGRAVRQLASRVSLAGRPQRTTSQANNTTASNLILVSSPRQASTSSSSGFTGESKEAPKNMVQPAKSGQTSQPARVQPAELEEIRPSRPIFYHDQMEWLDERLVRISRPTKNVMQSGTAYTNCWKIEFDSQPRDEYWLIGWTGTKDPMSNLTLTFPTKEKAIEFCEKNQLHWFLEEQPERKVRRKSYADNFSWNKRTRLGSK